MFIVCRQPATAPADKFVCYVDRDGALAQKYGAEAGLSVFVLSENLRVIQVVRNESVARVSDVVRSCAKSAASRHAADGGHAPVLVIPDVFEVELCERLIDLWETGGNEQTGVETSRDGQRMVERQQSLKRRSDHVVTDAALTKEIGKRLGRR